MDLGYFLKMAFFEKVNNLNCVKMKLSRNTKIGLINRVSPRVFFLVLCILVSSPLASEESKTKSETSKASNFSRVVFWPFEKLLQPLFEVLIYPVSEPLRYAFQKGIIEKGVELITFGENKNIYAYPVLNLKPGTATMLGFMYRHSDLIVDKDYLVLTGELYSNSDTYYSVRYSQKRLFDGHTYMAFQHSGNFNRDGGFRLLGTSDTYSQPDTTFRFNLSLAHALPIPKTKIDISTGVRLKYGGLPEKRSEWLDPEYIAEMSERGIYQDYQIFPQMVTLSFNNTESPYTPSSGISLQGSFGYHIVNDYSDIPSKEWDILSSEKEHDFMSMEFLFQAYFYLGKSGNSYLLTKKEARKKRREFADFSLQRFVKEWHPSKINHWLLERRVLALQWRYLQYFEMEKGGMPALSIPRLNDRFPLRGYDQAWASLAITGISLEYRWPIDYYIDGVIFNEYALFADDKGDFDFDNFRNAWGFGIRVRRPDMYFFRFQLGFHGLHGIHLVMTIAPEFQ